MPITRQFSASPQKYPHSNDTELLETPRRKQYRTNDEDSSPSTSSFSGSQQRRESPKKPPSQPEMNLEQVLRHIEPASNHSNLLALKAFPRGERAGRRLVHDLLHSAKANVMERFRRKKGKLLETELYLEWLNELDYVVIALHTALNAKVPGCRKRLPGFGRISYTILYNLVDGFIDDVNTDHDGSLSLSLEPSLYPTTMTLVEEAKDESTNVRSEEAVRLAQESLKVLDSVLANAVRRYKAECGRNNPTLAGRISTQEHALVKSCSLLCEQTGYGSEENDMRDTLMEETIDIMTQWKNEYEDCEDQLIDSD